MNQRRLKRLQHLLRCLDTYVENSKESIKRSFQRDPIIKSDDRIPYSSIYPKDLYPTRKSRDLESDIRQVTPRTTSAPGSRQEYYSSGSDPWIRLRYFSTTVIYLSFNLVNSTDEKEVKILIINKTLKVFLYL